MLPRTPVRRSRSDCSTATPGSSAPPSPTSQSTRQRRAGRVFLERLTQQAASLAGLLADALTFLVAGRDDKRVRDAFLDALAEE